MFTYSIHCSKHKVSIVSSEEVKLKLHIYNLLYKSGFIALLVKKQMLMYTELTCIQIFIGSPFCGQGHTQASVQNSNKNNS